MKNQFRLLLLGWAAVVLATGGNSLAQPVRPAKPVPPAQPAPPAKPVPPDQPDSEEVELLASQAALAKANTSLAMAEAKLGNPFSLADASSRTLVIPHDGEDSKSIADTEEDLNVMARILEKAASTRDERNAQAMGIFIHGPFSSQPAAPHNLYIEGYGALFFLSVNYPLVAPPPDKKEDAETRERTSSEWEAAHRELYQPPGSAWDLNGGYTKAVSSPPAEAYDADKVEGLKKNLISALKNAAHIRALKSDESVTVVVASRAGLAGPKTVSSRTTETHSQPVPKTLSGS